MWTNGTISLETATTWDYSMNLTTGIITVVYTDENNFCLPYYKGD